ncbi:MAG: FtsX-like permease family protein [Acidimicrobiia bacterium]
MNAAPVVLLSLPFLLVLATRPVLRRLALRNAIRRPREALLVVLGSLLGTAIITGSLIVGDTLNRSITEVAYAQLGPVDEVVAASGATAGTALHDQADRFRTEHTDGVLALVTARAAAANVTTPRRSAPRAQLVETDFRKARSFGGDAGATGISGRTPAPGRAAVTRDVADRLHLSKGATVQVFAYGAARQLVVDRILPRRGVAGLWLDRGQQSYNVFVAPGTIAGLAARAGAAAPASEPPQYVVAISNRGGVEPGAELTATVRRELRSVARALGVSVVPVKRTLLDAAKQTGDALSQLYTSMGMFAIAAGVLLLVNIFVMLADERRSEIGMLRAVGLRRSALVGAFATEGWLYAVVASIAGSAVGIGFGRVITFVADRILSSGREEDRLSLGFTFTRSSVMTGLVIGFAIALATVVLTCIRSARFNVIAAIRDLNEPRRRRPRRRVQWIGLTAAALGTVWTLIGFRFGDPFGVMAGPMLVMAGIGPALARRLPKGLVTTVLATGVLAWGALSITVVSILGIDFDVPIFVVQGLAMAAAAVVLVNQHQGAIGHVLGRLSGNSLDVRIGLAYPLARRFRTGMTLAMFSIVMFTLAYIGVVTHMFRGQLDKATQHLGGGFNVLVASNPTDPIPLDRLRTEPGVRAVAPMSYQAVDFSRAGGAPQRWALSGFDQNFVVTPPHLKDRGTYRSDRAAWTAVLRDPGLVVVDEFFLAHGNGPPKQRARVGDTLTVSDPQSNRTRTVKVAAVVEGDWLSSGAFWSNDAVRSFLGPRAVLSRSYVRASDPSTFARTLNVRYLANGADAEPIRSIIEARLSQQLSFFNLMQGYLAVGLVVGIAGIGVIMVRAVRERRREVGVLRALGFSARMVQRAFFLESLFVALEGVLIGVAIAFVTSYSLVATAAMFGDGLEWGFSPLQLGIVVAIALGFSLLATAGPARAAARIRPAVALRTAE